VGNMIDKYFGGKVPDPKGVSQLNGADGKLLAEFDWPTIIHKHVSASIAKADAFDIAGALGEGVALVKKVDAYINATEPFKLAKKLSPAEGTDGGFTDSPERDRLAAILYHCAEALRVAIMIHSPAVPDAAERMYAGWSCHPPIGKGHSFAHVAEWNLDHTGTHHSLKPGQALTKGAILFMRADPADAAPGAVAG